MTTTAACVTCGRAVAPAEPHLSINHHLERLRHGGIDVLAAETIATAHLHCGWGCTDC